MRLAGILQSVEQFFLQKSQRSARVAINESTTISKYNQIWNGIGMEATLKR